MQEVIESMVIFQESLGYDREYGLFALMYFEETIQFAVINSVSEREKSQVGTQKFGSIRLRHSSNFCSSATAASGFASSPSSSIITNQLSPL